MKKTLTALMLSFIGFTITSAQTNVIKFNIFAPIVKTANFQYEKAFGNKSFQLGAFYTGYSPSTTKFSGYGITPEFRFYLSDTPAPDGFYAAPFVRYQSYTIEETDPDIAGKATFSAIGGGFIIGKQWIFKEKVALDMFIGPSYANVGDLKIKTGNGDPESYDIDVFDGFGVRFGICFGLAF
jgi:hypothetical protein